MGATREAVSFHIEGLKEEGLAVPLPSSEAGLLDMQKPTLGFRDWPSKFASCFQPLCNHYLDVGERFLPGYRPRKSVNRIFAPPDPRST